MRIAFEERAVAFVDVLGFGALVDSSVADAAARANLNSLVELLDAAIPMLDGTVSIQVPVGDIPKHFYISDSLILSAPVRPVDANGYDGLSTVVMRCIQVAQLLLDAGFLVRGGIDIGQTWHGDANIVGPGYQGAYRIECHRSNPGIQLSDAAARRWVSGPLYGSTMCLQRDGAWIVNALEEFYFKTATIYGGIENTYRRYAEIVAANRRNTTGAALAKWDWFARELKIRAQAFNVVIP